MSNEYEPLTPEQRQEILLDAYEKPTYRDFKRIVLAADYLMMILECGNHSKDELDGAIIELSESLNDCIPASAIQILDIDNNMTSTDELKEILERDGPEK